MTPKKTSWGAVAEWYDDLLEEGADSYQKNVIMPNVIRILEPKKGMTVADIACGQGYFSRAFASNGATVVACDVSRELIDIAKGQGAKSLELGGKSKEDGNAIEYHVASADKLSFMADGTADAATIILALQNIENYSGALQECSRVLKTGGRLILVINHPAFRIPKSSSWQWESEKEYRRIDAYMSDQTFKIDMTPGQKAEASKKFTVSFHRPLQSYFKALNKGGLAVTRFEEWISHKKSQKGPHSAEEDRMRKEIPMFLCLEARKV